MDLDSSWRGPLVYPAGLAILSVVVGLTVPAAWRWEAPRFESALEVVFATFVFTSALLFLLSRKLRPKESRNPILVYGLLVVAGIKFLDASTDDIERTLWFHRLASMALAISFFLNWVPAPEGWKKRKNLWYVALTGWTLVASVSLVLFFSPRLILSVFSDREFSLVAKAFSFVAGLLFLCAVIFRTKRFPMRDLESFSSYLCCLSFCFAAFIFPLSTLWSPLWWLTQLLEILPLVVLMFSLVIANNRRVVESQTRLSEAVRELEAANGELERFSYVAAHDLAEPLRMVSSYCRLLSQRYGDVLDEKGRQYIAFAVDGAERMKVLIRALLDYSRIGKAAEPYRDVDCRKLVDQVLTNLSVSLREQQAEVEVGELPTISSDPTRLTQVFQNLIGNAVKYHKAGIPPRVEISARREGEGWTFSVRDNGIGIEREFFDQIFLMFRRLHGRDEYPGTGIGLASCKKLVESLGGRIWVESEPGVGSTFRFALPNARAPVATHG